MARRPRPAGDGEHRLRRLLDAGLVAQRGRGRNISYAASEGLRATVEKPTTGSGDPGTTSQT